MSESENKQYNETYKLYKNELHNMDAFSENPVIFHLTHAKRILQEHIELIKKEKQNKPDKKFLEFLKKLEKIEKKQINLIKKTIKEEEVKK